jgi:UDP-3-O-[3-hydroxymyristoyl] glucosamine N-acyltransferase
VPVLSLAELAAELGGVLEPKLPGRETPSIVGVQGIDSAGPEHLSFVSNRRYVRLLASTRAGAVLVDRDTPARGATVIRVDDPYLAFARALALFHPPAVARPGVHPSAVVAEDAVVEGVEVRALAFVGAGAVVGPGSVLHPGSHVGAGAVVGHDCVLMANAVVCDGCELGDRVVLNPGAVVGAEGFGFAPTPTGHVKIPQVGRAVVESDVELGAHSCVDRAALGETRVGRGTKTDNLVQIGHAAKVGEHALLVAYAAIAGSTELGRFVTLAAKALVLGHLRIGDGAQVGAGSMVTGDLEAGARASGSPAFEHRSWRRAALSLRELPGALKRLRRLERRAGLAEEDGEA